MKVPDFDMPLYALFRRQCGQGGDNKLGAEARKCRGCRRYGEQRHKDIGTMRQETLPFWGGTQKQKIGNLSCRHC